MFTNLKLNEMKMKWKINNNLEKVVIHNNLVIIVEDQVWLTMISD